MIPKVPRKPSRVNPSLVLQSPFIVFDPVFVSSRSLPFSSSVRHNRFSWYSSSQLVFGDHFPFLSSQI
ncbi:hypothetical protein K1719_031960 [Acacia pycnantha]|nr:hypothetical protein K1719_031960 [Acacia pycnantha]